MGILDKIFGDANAKIVKDMQPIIDKINALEPQYKKMSAEELRGVTGVFRQKLGAGSARDLDAFLPEAFAAVREASRRTLGQRHYDVQLIGGIVLHRGQIAEMKTGEGKTLVATLPLYLNALPGRGAQLITVNDYLSRVGAGWMAPVYHALGMTTGVIIHDAAFSYDPGYSDDSQYDDRLKHFRPVKRREAYACDIVYGTNNEFGFDYLRDNMVANPGQMVQRDLYYAIVDEVDSILIDEARTPLIISAPAEESTDKYYKFSQLVGRLKENEDYNVDEKMRAATLTEGGIGRMEKWLGVDNIYTAGGIREVHHIEQALKAHTLFKRDRDYVVKDGEVIIVDEFTGRLMHGRRYSEGLHQAIEAKEGAKIQRESQTLATITFQNYFRMYKKLSGMTGTASTEAEEFSKIYELDTVIIPTNKPNVRLDLNDLIYRTGEGKFKAVVAEIKRRHETGQPILVGTISIEKNEILAGMMEREGLHPQVLNAKNHEQEAKYIAQAGAFGAITIATNMAGRGVDIILGGAQGDKAAQEKVKSLGGLHVIGTERHESRRIDNQLRGRAGRQGDPGSSQFFVSMEDDLMRIFGGDRMKSIMTTLRVPDDMPIENRLISRSIESAQRKVEGNNFDIRKHLVEYDDVINKHRESIYRRRREILGIVDKKADGSLPPPESKADDKPAANLSEIILEMVENEIEQVVSFHTSAERITDWNLSEINQVISTIFSAGEVVGALDGFTKENNHKLDKAQARTAIIERLSVLARHSYGKIEAKAREKGIDWAEIEKAVLIRSIDTLWIEHLEAMASMRQGIGLRGYGQRDPLIEYKREAYGLYNELNNLIAKEVVYSIFKIGALQIEEREFTAPSLLERARRFTAPAKTMDAGTASFAGYKTAGSASSSGAPAAPQAGSGDLIKQKTKDAEGNKVGRNDPCPCGSGKKYKKCHGV
ncbi:preprotein translocase subunit SecA [Candidatus Falkowbacteria bacterium RIFOXYB2_FULL_47_14]|uniref:Protein translocase subunit SecA n=1 Tax=Candidatus Falkowbacteria bacterium RIFOXYA2_FULL_47_19 TaxID=1797994 RepID=A0A1F5SIK0_9BACT|nr:MAG: preprotein translocase subunit SecA [Candidatus Falkowbacteria bacterium RIFOXYA2_FULL_47_19]OGF34325.1 MAG: preprotein translocase subunit SecA [Candidatus Falkowbacteria bacterium RIFOXYC2_FULL_46_15]OGF42714.1 MAG: preprotein translocase subunit SecA [Candidatus Falkowbacteria bacterium RIFOXYB2_FULL_47_14]